MVKVFTFNPIWNVNLTDCHCEEDIGLNIVTLNVFSLQQGTLNIGPAGSLLHAMKRMISQYTLKFLFVLMPILSSLLARYYLVLWSCLLSCLFLSLSPQSQSELSLSLSLTPIPLDRLTGLECDDDSCEVKLLLANRPAGPAGPAGAGRPGEHSGAVYDTFWEISTEWWEGLEGGEAWEGDISRSLDLSDKSLLLMRPKVRNASMARDQRKTASRTPSTTAGMNM